MNMRTHHVAPSVIVSSACEDGGTAHRIGERSDAIDSKWVHCFRAGVTQSAQ